MELDHLRPPWRDTLSVIKVEGPVCPSKVAQSDKDAPRLFTAFLKRKGTVYG